jgi:UDP-galactopyranose mutase
MIQNMLDGVEIMLAAPPSEWTRIRATAVVYTGRPDLIPIGAIKLSVGEQSGLQLGFRTLDIAFATEQWHHESISLHACTLQRPWTRKTCFARMTGGGSRLISTETPRPAADGELTPYYPIETATNQTRFKALVRQIRDHYPNLHLAGRLGSYRYFDMYQAVGQALTLANRLCPP